MFNIQINKRNILNIITKLCISLALLYILFSSAISQAIVIRHDKADQQYRDLAKQYSPSIAYLDRCVATVLSKYWLITAAHCVSVKDQYPLKVSHLQINYPVEEIVLNPNAEKFDDLDIALLRLKWPLQNASPISIYEQTDELGKEVIFVGNGKTGNGLTGDAVRDKIERAATNTVDSVEAHWLSFIFNTPETATTLEGVSGDEDSGGPAFIVSKNGIQLVGVGCCQEPVKNDNGEEIQGGYLSTEYYSRISPHKTWIKQNINKPIPLLNIQNPISKALADKNISKAKMLLNNNKQWLKNPSVITDVLMYGFYRSDELSNFVLTTFPEVHSHKLKDLPLTTYAYLQGNGAILSLLIKQKVALDYTGFKGQLLPSLITWQYFNDDYLMQLKLLLNQGFDINAADDRGDSALHMAIYLGWPERVTILLELGANVNQVDAKGNSALIDAARTGKLEIVKILIANGANTALLNKEQKNAITSAKQSGFQKVVKYLNTVTL